MSQQLRRPQKMMKTNFILSNTSCMLLLVFLFLNRFAQSTFVQVEWTPQVSPSKQCGLAITSDLSDALAMVEQLVKSTTSSSFLPRSCMEIKESSPDSLSGYYTISNGTGGSTIVHCNMDELYSCPSLEQTLKVFSDTLMGVSTTVTEISSNLTGISSNLTGVSGILASNDACVKTSTSCQEVWDKCPECTSGYYKILAADLTEKYVHCNFGEKCGTAGPWTRVAFLNMSDSNSVCPNGTQKFVSGSAIACGIQHPSDAKCVSITNSVTHLYSQICGQVVGYQKGSPSAFEPYTNDINGLYVEGVSITRGSPRQHVWSYAIGAQENFYHGTNSAAGAYICPCGATSIMPVPSFVGSDYYCESGCPGYYDNSIIYSDDVLWDGQQCGVLETDCCTIPNQPWFHKVLDAPSSDSIEIRLCIDQDTSDENVLVSLYDIYVK